MGIQNIDSRFMLLLHGCTVVQFSEWLILLHRLRKIDPWITPTLPTPELGSCPKYATVRPSDGMLDGIWFGLSRVGLKF